MKKSSEHRRLHEGKNTRLGRLVRREITGTQSRKSIQSLGRKVKPGEQAGVSKQSRLFIGSQKSDAKKAAKRDQVG